MNWFGKKTGSSAADVTNTTTDNITIGYSQYATTRINTAGYSFVSPKRAIDEIYETAKITLKHYLPLTILLRGVVLVDVFSLKRIFKSHDGDVALPVEKFTPVHIPAPQPSINYSPISNSGVVTWTTYTTAWYGGSEQHELSNPGGRANSLIEPTITAVRM